MAHKHELTEENAEWIKKMGVAGIDQDTIAAVVGINPKTLRKYYKETLRDAAVKANVQVVAALFNNAVGGNVAAQIFWCKTRLGWRETGATEDPAHTPVFNFTYNSITVQEYERRQLPDVDLDDLNGTNGTNGHGTT